MSQFTTNTRHDVDDYDVWLNYLGYLGRGHQKAIDLTSEDFSLAPETVQWIVDDYSSEVVD
jgi:hypothetical protein